MVFLNVSLTKCFYSLIDYINEVFGESHLLKHCLEIVLELLSDHILLTLINVHEDLCLTGLLLAHHDRSGSFILLSFLHKLL